VTRGIGPIQRAEQKAALAALRRVVPRVPVGVRLATRAEGSACYSAILVCEGSCSQWTLHLPRDGQWRCSSCNVERRWG